MLKNVIISENYMDTLDSALVKAETNRIANGYDGRIEIINKDYIVVSDTYLTDEGKTAISEMVMRSMAGESVSYYNEKENYLEFALPIAITELTTASENGGEVGTKKETTKILGAVYMRYSTKDVEEYSSTMFNYAAGFDAIILVLAFICALLLQDILVCRSIEFRDCWLMLLHRTPLQE